MPLRIVTIYKGTLIKALWYANGAVCLRRLAFSLVKTAFDFSKWFMNDEENGYLHILAFHIRNIRLYLASSVPTQDVNPLDQLDE